MTPRLDTGIRSIRTLVLVVGSIVTFALHAPAEAQTPTPTPGGDCCSVHAGTGCDNAPCQACVCANPNGGSFCCSDIWDGTCVDIAKNVDECASSCPCTPNPTPTAGPGTPTPTPGGDCCASHDGASCDAAACAACVCATPGQEGCCTDVWDATCADVAGVECAGQCPCGTGECCTAHVGPGCESTVCEQCVCAVTGQDACCEDTWDSTCADVARVECASSCPCEPGSCCTARSEPGCGSAVCIDCVCQLDPGCCSPTAAWDAECVEIATRADQCLGRCACTGTDCCGTSDDPGCGSTVCTDCLCTLDQECCSESWDQTCVDEATDDAACGGSCACFTNDCCSAHPEAGCTDPGCVDCVCTLDPVCCLTGPGLPGWDATCAAVALSATECAGSCPCTEADCCAARDTPGCGNDPCRDCVCRVDPTCCSGIWDQTCVDIANDVDDCGEECPCLTGSDCCRRQTEPGCEDTACAACVCAIIGQETCCTDVWDQTCSEVAQLECAASCPCGGAPCPGDCDRNGTVAVNELVLGVNISLDRADVADCLAMDSDSSGAVAVNELVAAVNRALRGCDQ